MARVTPRVRRRAIVAAAATLAAAIPGIAQGAQYAYFSVPTQAYAFGDPPRGADMARVDITSGNLDYPWVTNANFSNGSGGNDFMVANYDRTSSKIAVKGQYIYWTNATDMKIGRMTTAGTNITPNWVSLTTTPYGLDVSGDYLYFSRDNGTAGGIGRVGLDGTGLNESYVTAGVGRKPTALRIAGTRMIWLQEGNQNYISDLYSCVVTSCTPALVRDGDTPMFTLRVGMAFDGTNAFGMDNMNGVVTRVGVPGGTTSASWWAPATYSNGGVSDTDGTDIFLSSFCNACGQSGAPRLGLVRTSIAAPLDSNNANRWIEVPLGSAPMGNYEIGDLRIAAAPVLPNITGVAPSSGPIAGGTPVSITGTGFTGTTAVTFGGVAASFTAYGDGNITAVTPAGTAGSAAVAVTNGDGTDTEVGAFEYTAPAPAPTPDPAPAPNVQAPTATPTSTGTWTPPSGREDAAITLNNARVDLAVAPRVETQGTTATVVTQMTVDEVGRYTVMYVAPKRTTRRASEAATATERVPFAKGTKVNQRKLKRKYTAVSFTTTKKGAQVTMRALLKRAKGRKLTLRVIYRSPDGTLKESRIKS